MAEAALAAASAIVHVAEATGLLELAGYWIRYAISMNLGWLRNAVWESVGRLTGVNKAEHSIGIPVSTMFGTLLDAINDAIRHQAVTGAPVIHHVLSAIYGTIYESYGRLVRTAVEAALRSRGVTELPTPFDIIWAGEQLEDMDELSLAWLLILSGAHPVHVVYNLLQSVKWLYEMHLSELRYDVDHIVRRFNDLMLADVDVIEQEVRYWTAEALRTYHRAVNRLASIVDHIAERTLVRIWEVRLAARTVWAYYTAGLVKPETVAKALVRLDREVEEAYKAFKEAMSMVEEVLRELDFEDEIERVLAALDSYKGVLGSWYKEQVMNLVAWEGARDTMRKIDAALRKMMVAKLRIDYENAIKPVARFWEVSYPLRPGELTIESLEGA